MIRSLVSVKLKPDQFLKAGDLLPGVDTIMSLQMLTNNVANSFVPALCNYLCFYSIMSMKYMGPEYTMHFRNALEA